MLQICNKNGCNRSHGRLGLLYFNGLGLDKCDDLEAFKLFTQGSKPPHNDPQAQQYLAYCYRHAIGVEKNYSLAVEWYTKSNTPKSKYKLGQMYKAGKGVVKDKVRGNELCEQALGNGFKPDQKKKKKKSLKCAIM